MSKIIMFLKDGKTTKADIVKKVELSVEGHRVIYSNGSFKVGFEDTCDAIIMSCKNETIVRWAQTNFIEVSYTSKEFEVEVAPIIVAEKEEIDEDLIIDVSSETIAAGDVEETMKALESQVDEATDETPEVEVNPDFEVPPSVEAGTYVDPLGTEYLHKGRGYKKEFKAAIKKFGVDNVKLMSEKE